MSAICSASPSAHSAPLDDSTLTKEEKIEIAALLKKEGLISRDVVRAYCRAGSAVVSEWCKKDPTAFRFTILQALQHFPKDSLKTTPLAKERIAALLAPQTPAKDRATISRDDTLEMCALLINQNLLSTKTVRACYHVGSSTLQKYCKKAESSARFTPQDALKHIPKELLKKDPLVQQKIAELTAKATPPPNLENAQVAKDIPPKAETPPQNPASAQVAKDIPAGHILPAAAPKAAEPIPLSENFVHWVNLYRADDVPLHIAIKRCGMEEDEFKLAAKRVPICDRKAVEKALAVMMPERLIPQPPAPIEVNPAAALPLPPLPIPHPQSTAIGHLVDPLAATPAIPFANGHAMLSPMPTSGIDLQQDHLQ